MTDIEHGRTKRTNVLTPNKTPTKIEHGRTKHTNVQRPNKIPTYIEHAILSIPTYKGRMKRQLLIFLGRI